MKKITLFIVSMVSVFFSIEAAKVEKKMKHTSFQEHSRSYFFEAGAGGAFYGIKRGTFLDIGSNPERVKNSKSKIAPLGLATFGVVWDNMPAFSNNPGSLRLGIRGYYAGKKDGVTIDYYEPDDLTAQLQIKHKVQDARLSFLLDYQCFDEQVSQHRMTFNVLGATVLSFKTLGDLKIYEKTSGAYIGQKLKPQILNVLGEVGGTFGFYFREKFYLKAGYTYTGGRVRYKKNIVIETPGTGAGAHNNDALLIIGVANLQLPEKPKFTLGVHMFYGVFGVDF